MACGSPKPARNYYRYPLKQNRNSNTKIIFHFQLKVIMNSMIHFDISRQRDPSKILCFIPTTFCKDVQYIHETKHYGRPCGNRQTWNSKWSAWICVAKPVNRLVNLLKKPSRWQWSPCRTNKLYSQIHALFCASSFSRRDVATILCSSLRDACSYLIVSSVVFSVVIKVSEQHGEQALCLPWFPWFPLLGSISLLYLTHAPWSCKICSPDWKICFCNRIKQLLQCPSIEDFRRCLLNILPSFHSAHQYCIFQSSTSQLSGSFVLKPIILAVALRPWIA